MRSLRSGSGLKIGAAGQPEFTDASSLLFFSFIVCFLNLDVSVRRLRFFSQPRHGGKRTHAIVRLRTSASAAFGVEVKKLRAGTKKEKKSRGGSSSSRTHVRQSPSTLLFTASGPFLFYFFPRHHHWEAWSSPPSVAGGSFLLIGCRRLGACLL